MLHRIAISVLALAAAAGAQESGGAAPEAAAGVRAAAREILDGLVEGGVPGASAALVLPGGEVVALAAGFASVDDELPLTPEHLLLVGSAGKTYVTAAAHRLVHAGKLELDVPVASYFEGEEVPWLERVPNAGAVTLRQLLRHETGIPRYVFKPEFTAEITERPDRAWRPEELLAFVFDDEPLFAPGEGWAYSDTNYVAAGILIEKAAGRPFYDLVRAELLEPHDLARTVPSDRRRIPGMAQGHVVMGRQLGVPARTLAKGEFVYNVQFEWCGGGWATTPGDLARWVGILYSGEAFDAPYLATLLDTVEAPALGPGVEYGLGAMVRDTPAGRLVFHDGFMPGYLTSAGYFPEHGIAAALQLNGDDSRAVGRPLSDVLVELAEAALEALGR